MKFCILVLFSVFVSIIFVLLFLFDYCIINAYNGFQRNDFFMESRDLYVTGTTE